MAPDGSLARLGLPAAVTERWRTQLGDDGRVYHGLGHIEALLADLPDAAATPELIAAIWLHDIVYDARASDNEARSAEQARADLAGSGIDVERVVALILSTRHHDGDTAEQRLLGDLDLAILGAPAHAYARYADAIRREYAHVPDAAYRAGRAAVLRHFLARPAIYRTAAFTGREAQARANLSAEIVALDAGPG